MSDKYTHDKLIYIQTKAINVHGHILNGKINLFKEKKLTALVGSTIVYPSVAVQAYNSNIFQTLIKIILFMQSWSISSILEYALSHAIYYF